MRPRLLFAPLALLLSCTSSEETASSTDTGAGGPDVADVYASGDPGSVETPDVSPAEDAPPPDTSAPDTSAPDTRDAAVPDVGPQGCCASDQDCAVGEFCAPESKDGEATGQCLLRLPPKGQCWKDSDCGEPGAVCGGVVFKGCGDGESELGLCDVVIPPGCCDSNGGCPSGFSCWQDYCLPESAFKGCMADSDCSQVGWICAGAVEADGSCLKGGGAPTFGACEPSGPGGQCVVATTADLGDCPDVLGWGWQGVACVELTGCGCGDVCDGVFATQEECEAACSPPLCCSGDEACGAGRQCVSGHCVVTPGEGRCFSGAACDEGLVCAGASSCACGEKWCSDGPIFGPLAALPPICDNPPCIQAPVVLGTCVEAPLCCDADGGCPGDAQCVPHAWDAPRCLAPPDGGSCWTKADCGADEWCVGAESCGCNQVECVPTQGACEVIPAGCCTESAACPEGLICTAETSGPPLVGQEVGECVPPPESGCYSDAQCPDDSQCLWFSGWVCGDPLTWGPPAPGECVEKDGMCCTLDADCADGFGCARSPDGGVCKPAPQLDGECWDTSDCAADQVCTEAKPCGQCSACQGESTLGSCVAAAGLCCVGDADCGAGEWCTALTALESWSPPGAGFGQCVKASADAGKCFNNGHCGLDQVCSGFSGYPCGYPAPSGGGGKGDLWPGDCVAADGACCSSDLGCADGYRCVGQGAPKEGSGACKPMKFDGSCWTDLDCSDNEHCEGGFVCGCAWCGGQVDTLGSCVPN